MSKRWQNWPLSSLCFFWLLFVPLLTSCGSEILTAHTDFLTLEHLASYRVNTPDPRRRCPTVGQRLIVNWCLPERYRELDDLRLAIVIRFCDGEEITQSVEICQPSGTYVYPLLNELYFEKGGIQTYKVDLIGDGTRLDAWRHQIWAERITFAQEGQDAGFNN